jgi:hypothetical protein
MQAFQEVGAEVACHHHQWERLRRPAPTFGEKGRVNFVTHLCLLVRCIINRAEGCSEKHDHHLA